MGLMYKFPAVMGRQAKSEYYICMVECKYLANLFIVNRDEDVMPEYRAQRRLNINRIPEIKNYIINNRDTYVFSALAASIDGKFSFIPVFEGSEIGYLEVDASSVFLINDGQHRNAAIQEALNEDSSLGDENIPVVFFADKGLKRSQQMFTDLNKYAVKPSKSQNTYYDHKDELAIISKEIIAENRFLRDYTDVESDSLGKFSAKLFTLNSFYTANQYIVGSMDLSEDVKQHCKNFWNFVVNSIYEWQLLIDKEITKKSLREEYIVTQNIVLYALGKLGNFFLKNPQYNMGDYLPNLKKINWLRTNEEWDGRSIVNGKISVKSSNITLTYIKIKELIGIPLEEKEKILNEIR